MSKTVEIQIEKSRGLIEGLRRHVREMGEHGVSSPPIWRGMETFGVKTATITKST